MAEIYDWEATLQSERSTLMDASILNWTAGTVAYIGAAALSIDADIAFMKLAKVSGAPSKSTLLELVAAVGLTWIGRGWRTEARQQHVEAYELV